MMPCWRLARGVTLPLDRPRLMAIINVTPDSFSDGGECFGPEAALERIRRCIAEGADALDIGGESTRPGSEPVPAEEQIRRVVPVIRAARDVTIDAPISIDTTRAAVARAALDAGADAINDVSAGLDDPSLLPLAAERGAGLILMHRLRAPALDRYSTEHRDPPRYEESAGGVVGVVRGFLAERAAAAECAGVARERLVLDPGLGFGKTVEQNFALLRAAPEFLGLGFPILCAASRKSFLSTPGDQPRDRVAASVAVSVAQCLAGVRLFRVHDVQPHAAALRAVERLAAAR
jgi:dihydropteroate synthase